MYYTNVSNVDGIFNFNSISYATYACACVRMVVQFLVLALSFSFIFIILLVVCMSASAQDRFDFDSNNFFPLLFFACQYNCTSYIHQLYSVLCSFVVFVLKYDLLFIYYLPFRVSVSMHSALQNEKEKKPIFFVFKKEKKPELRTVPSRWIKRRQTLIHLLSQHIIVCGV